MPTCGPSRAEPKRGSGAPHIAQRFAGRAHRGVQSPTQRRAGAHTATSGQPGSDELHELTRIRSGYQVLHRYFVVFFFSAVMHPKAPPERQHAAPDAPSSRGSAALRRTGFLRDSRDAAVIASTAQPRRGRRAEVRGSEREGRPRSHGAPRRTPPSHSPLKQRSRSLPRATVGSPSTSWKSAILRGSGGR